MIKLHPAIGDASATPTVTVSAGGTYLLAGTLSSTAVLYAYGGTQPVAAAQVLVTGTAVNDGTISLGGGAGGQYLADLGTGATLNLSGTLTNNALITLAGGSPWAASPMKGHGGDGAQLQDSGILINAGTIVLSEGSTAPSRNPYIFPHGSGYGATLSVTGSLDNLGLITVGVVNTGLGADITIAAGATLTNAGTIQLADGIGSNSLVVDGVLQNSGLLSFTGGGDGKGHFTDSPSLGTVAGTLVNTGTITIGHGNLDFLGNGVGGATLTVTGVLTNQNNITVDYSPFAGYYGTGPGGELLIAGSLSNTGSLTIQGGDSGYSAYVDITATGTLNNTGYLAIQYLSEPFSGEYRGGVLTNQGDLSNTGTIGVDTTSPFGYGALFNNATLTNSGVIRLGGEYISISATGTFTNNTLITDTASRSGAIVNHGRLINAGTIAIAGANAMRNIYGEYGHASTITDDATLINRGAITLAAGANKATPAAALTITSTGTLLTSGTISGAGTLDNAGTIDALANSSPLIAVASFLNDGLVNTVPLSLFFINSPVTADAGKHGVFDISTKGALEFSGSVANTQQITFAGPNSALLLAKPSQFQGIIAGIAPQTAIDFLHLAVTSATTTNDTLAIGLASGATLDLTLAAPLAPTITLHLSTDGHGGTDLFFGNTG